MRGFIKGVRLLVLGLGVGTLLGCQDNESMVFIRGALRGEPGNCELSADESATLLTNGVLDTVFGSPYGMALLVGNQMASRGQKTRARTETSNVLLEGAEVSLRRPNGDLVNRAFTAPGTGFVPVGSGEGTGYGVMSIVAIPWDYVDDIVSNDSGGGYVIAEVKAFGTTLGGQEVESGVFKFPISVCRGCLIRYPANLMTTSGCTASKDEETLPCRLGQDDPINCSICAYEYAICRSP